MWGPETQIEIILRWVMVALVAVVVIVLALKTAGWL
jgi:hypothetical protein